MKGFHAVEATGSATLCSSATLANGIMHLQTLVTACLQDFGIGPSRARRRSHEQATTLAESDEEGNGATDAAPDKENAGDAANRTEAEAMEEDAGPPPDRSVRVNRDVPSWP